jgi:hypothetical protein
MTTIKDDDNNTEKDKKLIKNMITIEDIIKNKTNLDYFTSLFGDKIERHYIIDMIIRVCISFPFLILALICFSNNLTENILSFILVSFCIFSLMFSFQGHLVLNDKIFPNKYKKLPFISFLLKNYFFTYRNIRYYLQKYKILNQNQKILINSIQIPKSGCDFYVFNLHTKIKQAKPSIIFKHKDIILFALENTVQDTFLQAQLLSITEQKLLKYEINEDIKLNNSYESGSELNNNKIQFLKEKYQK